MDKIKQNARVRGWDGYAKKWRRGTYQGMDEGVPLVKWDEGMNPRTQALELIPKGLDNEDADDPHREETTEL